MTSSTATHRHAADHRDFFTGLMFAGQRQTSIDDRHSHADPLLLPITPRRGACHTCLLSRLPRTPCAVLNVFSVHTQERDDLSNLEWVRELESRPAIEQVLTAGALLSRTSVLPEDHIVRTCMPRQLTERFRNKPWSRAPYGG